MSVKRAALVFGAALTLAQAASAQVLDQAGWKCAYNEKREWKCVYVADPRLPTPTPVTTKYCNLLLFYCPANQTTVPTDYPLVRRPRETNAKCLGSARHPTGIDPIDCQRCAGNQDDPPDCPRR